MMNNNIIFASIGVLLVSCVYLLYVNHQLKKQYKLLERKLRLASAGIPDEAAAPATAAAAAAAEASAESEMNSAAEAVVDEAGTNVDSGENLREKYQEYQDNMDYYIDESIPEDLKREIDNLEQEDEEVVAEEEAGADEEEVGADEEEAAADEEEVAEEAAEEAVYDMNAIIQAKINQINPAAKEAAAAAEAEPEPEAEAEEEPEAEPAETLQKLTMKQLKDLAREKGIKTSGKKDELIERLSV
jgi:hypothetical protein